MSLAQGNNTPTRPRIEPGSPDPESDALTTRPVRSLDLKGIIIVYYMYVLFQDFNCLSKNFAKFAPSAFKVIFIFSKPCHEKIYIFAYVNNSGTY